jgi:hypothetical protein
VAGGKVFAISGKDDHPDLVVASSFVEGLV